MASAATRGQSRRAADLSASVTLEVAARAIRAVGKDFISFGPGGEVFLPVPYWTSYPERVRLAGADPAVVASRMKLESWQ